MMVSFKRCFSILHTFKKGDPGGASIIFARYLLFKNELSIKI